MRKTTIAIILFALLIISSVGVMAINGYPTIYERAKPFRYCSLIDNGHLMSLQTGPDYWTTTKHEVDCN